MTFNSFSFLLLLPVIFSLYYCIPSKYHRQRNLYLLLASYLFYMSWKPLYVFFLLFVTLTTYFFPLLMNGRKDHSRRLVMWSGLIISILPLFLFKYHNFVDGNILLLLSKFGIHFCLPGLNWAIPIGISFFTLQAVGYMLDVYWHRIEAERDFLDYALFVSFFPSIVSGPINKAAVMIPQIKNPRPYFNYEKAVRGLKCLLWGMFLKVVVADRVGLYVWTVDVDFIHFSGSTCLLASVLYTIQIYADFAGYSLMALGVGKLVGIDVQENFRRPYFACSVTDFWHRWHLSLSMWLRDYVYIPLGGNRCRKVRCYCNILVTFLVSGLWHGANWTDIVWGLLHGLAQIIEKYMGWQRCNRNPLWHRLMKIFLTYVFVDFAFIIFRSPNLDFAFRMVGKICNLSDYGSIFVPDNTTIVYSALGILMLFIKDVTDEFFPSRFRLLDSGNLYVRWFSYVSLLVIIMLAGVFDASQFIYAMF